MEIRINQCAQTDDWEAVARAWHDVVCPEAEECRDRGLHVLSLDSSMGLVLTKFLARLAELRMNGAMKI